MNNNENKKSSEELADEALDQVAGGMTLDDFSKYLSYYRAFMSRNNCDNCNNDCEGNCLLNLGWEGLYKMFDGNPNATCPYKT